MLDVTSADILVDYVMRYKALIEEGNFVAAQKELLSLAYQSKSIADMLDGLPHARAFPMSERVRKIRGSQWQGKVVGFYSTDLTPEGYAVESELEVGSVQIYPAAALERTPKI